MNKRIISVLMVILSILVPVVLSESQSVQANTVVMKKSGDQQTIRRGSRGKAVKDLQWYLNSMSKNFNKPEWNCGTADGIFGARTESAVWEFQKAHPTLCGPADGICGPKTWATIMTYWP